VVQEHPTFDIRIDEHKDQTAGSLRVILVGVIIVLVNETVLGEGRVVLILVGTKITYMDESKLPTMFPAHALELSDAMIRWSRNAQSSNSSSSCSNGLS
jgi:hypothetical protein